MSRMGAPGTWSKAETPWPWDPDHAVSLFDAANLIDVYLDGAVPISREMVLLFFFHETAFSDIRQRVKKKKPTDSGLGPGVGFGQLEIGNSDKPAFLRQVYGISPDETLFIKITGDPEFAIKLHCEYLKHLYRNGATSMRALVNGQVGGKSQNAWMADYFIQAEQRLKASIHSSSRESIIAALNSCRWYVDVKGVERQDEIDDGRWFNPIPYPKYKKYWDFTLPPGEMMWGIRK